MDDLDVIEEFFFIFDGGKKRRSYSVFDTISGRLHIKICKQVKTTGIYLKIVGKQHVLWHEKDELVNGKKLRTPFTANNHFLEQRIYFMRADKEDAEKPEAASDGMMVLEEGKYDFKFQFRIADFFSSDVKNLPPSVHHELGEVKYFMSGVVERHNQNCNHQSIQFLEIHKSVPRSTLVMNHSYVSLSQCTDDKYTSFVENVMLVPTMEKPFFSDVIMNDSNSILLGVYCERGAYRPGESIRLDVQIENKSSTRKLNKLSMKLNRVIEFTATEPIPRTKRVVETVVANTLTSFKSNKSNLMRNIILALPPHLNPPTILEESLLIRCHYELRVRLYVSPKLLTGISSVAAQINVPLIIYNHEVEN